jgi:hypothetical protein
VSAADTPWFHRTFRTFAVGFVALAVAATVMPGAAAEPTTAADAGFVDITSVIPDARVDLRYATADNFVGKPLYPVDARCLVHESLGPGLPRPPRCFGPRDRSWCSGTATGRTRFKSRCSTRCPTRTGWRDRDVGAQP